MIYWVHRLSCLLVRVLPLGVTQWLLETFAPLVAWLWPGHRLRAEQNLARVLGPGAQPERLRHTVRAVFRNYARYMLDLVRLPQTDLGRYDREVVAHGLEHFEAAVQSGRGVVLATGHIGNWDLPAAWLAARGYRVNVPVERLQPERWNEQVQALRRAAGLRPIPMENVRSMVRALRRKEILGVLVDRPLTSGGVCVEFFGAPTRVPAGAARLALNTGAVLLAAAAVRDQGRPTIYVSPPLSVTSSGDPDRDAQALTQQIMAWLEAIIRRYPDQWYMFREMWPGRAEAIAKAAASSYAV